MTKFRFSISQNGVFWIIMLVAFALRFYNIDHYQYTHDELSALSRSGHWGISDLINKGVLTDTHPAGIQALVNYWSLLFGTNEVIIKLPFIVMGLLSIVLVYQLASKIYNASVATLVASFMACMQFAVLYSQLARPYVSGMFFTLVLVWGWWHLLFSDEKKIKQASWFCAGMVLCAYNHHISSFFAAVIAVTGLLFLTKDNYKFYLATCMVAVLLYLPHLAITLKQFEMGGVGTWLAKPSPDFILKFTYYLFHYAPIFAGLAILLVFVSIVLRSSLSKLQVKATLVFITWFTVLYLVCYYYSVYKNPVLQFSLLIFAFPFLLMGLFACIKSLKPVYNAGLALVILTVGTITLVANRSHYEMMRHQPYEYFFKQTAGLSANYHSKRKVFGVFSCGSYLLKPYFERYPDSTHYQIVATDIKYSELKKIIDRENPDIICIATAKPAFVLALQAEYPYVVHQKQGFGFEYYALSKHKNDTQDSVQNLFYKQLAIGAKTDNWNYNANWIVEDNLGKKWIELPDGEEWGPSFVGKYGDVVTQKFNFLGAMVSVSETTANAALVISIEKDGQSLFWAGADAQDFVNRENGAQKLANCIRTNDLTNIPADADLKIYLWNIDKKRIRIADFELKVNKANPLIYGVVDDIHP